MKFNYKWPILSTQHNVQQTILVNKKTKQEAYPTEETLIIGSVCVIVYFIMIMYIYISALVNEFNQTYKSKNLWDFISKFKNNPMSFFKGKYQNTAFPLNTLSSSFEDSERIGTVVLVIMFLATMQGLFSSQNIYSSEPRKAVIIAFNYLIVMCWLLFLYIFPYTKLVVAKKVQLISSKPHAILAFSILAALVINCFLILNLYHDFFDADTLTPLNDIAMTIVAAAGVAVVVMIINYFSTKSIFKYTHPMVAICEMICLILFGVFIIMFIQYPPVPNNQLSCVLMPMPSPTSSPTLSPTSSPN